MNVEIRRRADDPLKVDFYADGRRIENMVAVALHKSGTVVTAKAVVVHDTATAASQAKAAKRGRSQSVEEAQ